MKKRGLAGLLALALILALGACGGTEAQEDAAQDQKMEEAAPPQEEETSETDGEDGVPVTIEGPETADDSQQLQEDEPDLGSRPADPAKEPETGSRPADPAEKPVYQPVEDTKPQQPDKGFVVIGFPANNFLHQEPGTNEEIKEFCTLNYG